MAKKTMPASHAAKPAKGEAAKVRAKENKMMTPSESEHSSTDAVMDHKVAKALNREG